LPAELRSLRLASGTLVQTPLLVPSFSSKGFGLVDDHPPRTEVSPLLGALIDQLSRSFLVSAYDLHHRLLEVGDTFADPDWSASPLSKTEVLFIDSGGYEVRQGADAGELVQHLDPPLSWNLEMYRRLLERLPAAAENCAAVAWDMPGQTYETQVKEAQEFLAAWPNVAPVMLLKPPVKDGAHDFAQLEPVASRLAFSSAVGVTEHELGDTLLKRVIAIMMLRDLLARTGHANKPIHIFGALDPLYVPLYFAAGADIFDGLTWLRYSYWHGLALHVEQGPLLNKQTHLRDDARRWTTAASNLTQLGQLRTNLMRFVNEGEDWAVYDDTLMGRQGEMPSDVLRATYRSAVAERSS
jgi:hypothetical protein